jgi:hypothetical protein
LNNILIEFRDLEKNNHPVTQPHDIDCTRKMGILFIFSSLNGDIVSSKMDWGY